MSTLRLTLIALLAAASLAAGLGTAARACNEECTAGFVFDDAEGSASGPACRRSRVDHDPPYWIKKPPQDCVISRKCGNLGYVLARTLP